MIGVETYHLRCDHEVCNRTIHVPGGVIEAKSIKAAGWQVVKSMFDHTDRKDFQPGDLCYCPNHWQTPCVVLIGDNTKR